MTSPSPDNLGELIRVIATTVVQQTMAKQRQPGTLAGRVEQLDQDLDIAWTRMDGPMVTTDPTQTANYGAPGVVPVTRIGEAFTGDQVRVNFRLGAGADANRTSNENVIVLPFGTETGRRIVLDGNQGFAAFFDEDDALVGLLDTDLWAMGDIDPPGARATFDPVGGLRMRDALDHLVSIMDQQGYVLRNSTTGQITADLHHGGLRLVDPNGTDDIELVTSSAGVLQTPSWVAAVEASPGSSLVIPVAPVFTTTPADDISIGHVAAWLAVTNQAATMTPPGGYTERTDAADTSAAGTLATSVATLDPATGATATFTSSQSNWQHAIGTHIVVKGSGATSPAYRSSDVVFSSTAGGKTTVNFPKPAGVVAGDLLVGIVSIGVSGGYVPPGWKEPDGFRFAGAAVSSSGSGSSQSTLAVGAWYKYADAGDVAASNYPASITLPAGLKSIQGTTLAISNPYTTQGGVQIRLGGFPMRKRLRYNELSAASTTLCDFQNIEPGFDNLELVYDGTSNGGGAPVRAAIKINNDATAGNYFSQVNSDGAISQEFGSNARILVGALGVAAGAASVGEIKILGYSRALNRHGVIGHAYWVTGVDLRDDTIVGQWGSGTTPIDRISVISTGATQWQAGSRAYLYGY